MSRHSIEVFSKLNNQINKLERQKDELDLLTKNTYFSRKPRKLSFKDDIKIIMSLTSHSLKKELYDYFDLDLNTVSAPGFIESRSKIKDNTFKYLIDYMNKAYPCTNTYKGYRLLAVDGSDINISLDKDDKDTIKINGTNNKPAAQVHLNALYDVLNYRYLDAVIQGVKTSDERAAMIELSERYKGDKAIFIADRNYISYNLFEHIRHTGNYFLIRLKDINSNTSVLKRFKALPKKSEFDKEMDVTFTNKQTKEVKAQPHKYISIMTSQHFDYLDKNNYFYDASYRVVRIKINGKDEEYESLITNIPKDEFDSNDIKELYKRRWGIEVSYRHLKYSVSLNVTHSKRRDFIKQEIWAKLLMFNISMIIIDKVLETKFKKTIRKHEYQVNISMAMYLIMSCIKKKGGIPPNLLNLIAKEILPIRPNRSSIRTVRSHSFVSFGYRFN